LSVEIENVRKDVRMRPETDSMMSTAWILAYVLPIFLVMAWIVAFFVALISAFATFRTAPPGQPPSFSPPLTIFALIPALYLIAIASIIINVMLMYRLVKRRNTHFKRQTFLFEDVIASIKTASVKKGVDVEVSSASMDRTLREAKIEETEKSAVLWALLSIFVPFVSWYVYYFLMKDFYRHERREDGFWEDMSKTLDRLGIKFSLPRRTEPIPDRNFFLYLIVTLITAGILGIYWIYVLLKDPNNHFGHHIQVEEPLLNTLETALTA